MNKRCVALYSGGLDSILAIRLMQEQGIEVIALYFTSPFFGLEALLDAATYRAAQEQRYGITVQVIDFTDDIIEIIRHPAHGFGKNINPCIDCKIGMIKRAGGMLAQLEASFVVTGEVLGQRPMSQRRDAMHAIERDAGLKGLLLRPLCALNMPETIPESQGVVDRSRLLSITGRGRKDQARLAEHFDLALQDIPTPAGGCLLTDAQIAFKLRHTLARFGEQPPARADVLLDVVGRKFALADDCVFVVSRNEKENRLLAIFRDEGNTFIKIEEVKGPLGVLRGPLSARNLALAAGICLRYGKGRGRSGLNALYGPNPHDLRSTVAVAVLGDDECRSFQIDLNVQDLL